MSLAINTQNALPAPLTSLIEDTIAYAAASRSESTRRQYESNWKSFQAFCLEHGLSALPTTVQVVSVYLTSLAKEGRAVSTVISHLSAIKYFHDRDRSRGVNWSDPVLSEVLAGIRRTSTRKVVKAAAISPEDLLALVNSTGANLAGQRDRALLLVGFGGAFRRSELVSIRHEHLVFTDQGLVVTLERSKTDQEGEGAEVCIPHSQNPHLCPVIALQLWLERAEITSGPVFRSVTKGGSIGREGMSDEAVRLILARTLKRSGLEGTGRISPHSLRAGFCTSAAVAGRSLQQIGRHARHASAQTTLGYVRVAERFKDHAGVGLL